MTSAKFSAEHTISLRKMVTTTAVVIILKSVASVDAPCLPSHLCSFPKFLHVRHFIRRASRLNVILDVD